jgi:Flp pilus assembly protein TadG
LPGRGILLFARKISTANKRGWLAESAGASAVEFALILPVFLLVIFAIIGLGIFLNGYAELANGAATGARQASVNRGSTTPYSSTISAVKAGAPNLTSSKITISITVNGTACTSDTGPGTTNVCQTAYSNSEGAEAVVSATYPCNFSVLWITFPGCTMSSSSSQIIE